MREPYEDQVDPGLLATIPESIDATVHSGLRAGYRGMLEVLASGFGKGLLAAAAIFVAGSVIAAVAAPAMLGLAANISFGAAVEQGLIFATSNLVANGNLWLLLGLGGVIGSLSEAHDENTRISEEAAKSQAIAYQKARECAGKYNQPDVSEEHSFDCPNSNCAKFINSLKQQTNRQSVAR